MTVGLFIWYIARGIHMLASAFQVRDGYPKFIVGDVMMKSNPVSWILYVGFVAQIFTEHQSWYR